MGALGAVARAALAVGTDPACACTLAVAGCAAGYGAVRSVAEERRGDGDGRASTSGSGSLELDRRGAVAVPVGASAFLLAMYYLGAVGATEVLAVAGGAAGVVGVAFATGSAGLAAVVGAAWLVTGHWALNDAMGVCLVAMAASHLRLPDLRTAALLLSLLLVYDVFWVYASPWFMPGGDVVMVAVATQTATSPLVQAAQAVGLAEGALPRFLARDIAPPAKLIIPDPLGRPGDAVFLGLGDVAVPALLLSLALAWDARGRAGPWQAARRGLLFRSSLAAYVFALLLTLAVGVSFDAPQPALFFIVPAMLTALAAAAARAGVLGGLWRGPRPRALDAASEKRGGDAGGESDPFMASVVVA